ncbi:exodeoxyribonuclease VII large subunit [Levilactobacillus bambusae]|uniref:Exodeoxyribonuclease 7 large subunit n=1 Tax=Levilactobacillus bambusae TaxID=2024736 RepID=A0A2V1N5M3_9LACO|nr:exodeoxyribonuclease VII large subunit [Levilactobacillus bambusae]PWG00930.1 exodeoxyribonuclease VII large subunit [Levilactobacillus bambusae]
MADYLSVSALTQYLKRKFDVDPYLGKVFLTGEISNFRLRPNAHQYFSLKDDNAKINAIMFKSSFQKLKFQPETGMKVLVTGRVSLYERTGEYQIYVDRMEPDGVGQLFEAYEQLKRKLADEGLFSRPKRPLPRFPKRIAVVTSPSGAVIRDIITTVRRRFPIAQIVLFPALVQGQEAAQDITRQIKRANQIGSFDTLIIGRGGGSIEDLWPFNEESVARAIAESQLPVISSVGHETDTTIADLVADVRAATPTAAAELAVPVLSDVLAEILKEQNRLYLATSNLVKNRQNQLNRIRQSYVFQQPQRLYEAYLQRLDTASRHLNQVMTTGVTDLEQRLQLVRQRLLAESPTRLTHDDQARVSRDTDFLNRAIQQSLQTKRQRMERAVQSLDQLSPLKIMGRGFTYTTADDEVMTSIKQLHPGTKIDLHFADGLATATVETVKPHEEE